METIEEICEQSGDGPEICGMLVPHTCQDVLAEVARFAFHVYDFLFVFLARDLLNVTAWACTP